MVFQCWGLWRVGWECLSVVALGEMDTFCSARNRNLVLENLEKWNRIWMKYVSFHCLNAEQTSIDVHTKLLMIDRKLRGVLVESTSYILILSFNWFKGGHHTTAYLHDTIARFKRRNMIMILMMLLMLMLMLLLILMLMLMLMIMMLMMMMMVVVVGVIRI